MIIDSHMHCGIQNSDLPISIIRSYLDDAGIDGACLIPPVEDIYDRSSYFFQDNKQWMLCREQANNYLLDIQRRQENYGAYFFVWNDFRKDQLADGYRASSGTGTNTSPLITTTTPAARSSSRKPTGCSCPFCSKSPTRTRCISSKG